MYVLYVYGYHHQACRENEGEGDTRRAQHACLAVLLSLYSIFKMAHLPSTSKTVKFGDKDYETTLWRWFNEDDDDASDVDQVELDCALDCDHDSNSEQSASEAESNEATDMELDDNQDQKRNLGSSDRVENQNRNYYYGKNRYKWSQSTPFKKIVGLQVSSTRCK
nr:unnamed protein product [Callosobruchus analis]